MPPIIGQFERKIEILPLVGTHEDGYDVVHKIKQIFLNGARVGYTGEKPGDPISIIRRGVATDQETMAAIEAAVAVEFGAPASKVVVAPVLTDQQFSEAKELGDAMLEDSTGGGSEDPDKVAL